MDGAETSSPCYVPAMLRRDVPLAPLTSLRLGGAADFFAAPTTEEALRDVLRQARRKELPVAFLGGGSNTIVPDGGFRGLVIHLALDGVHQDGPRWSVGAGASWPSLVESVVSAEMAGIECLAGIPGSVGATPIQNVGAYGQEVSGVIESVRCLSLDTLEPTQRDAETCAFAYRDSDFKRHPGRYVVTEVRFRFTPGGAPLRTYRELQRATTADATLAEVHAKVLSLRKAKSMVLDPADANSVSAGSFFTNLILSWPEAEALRQRCLRLGLVDAPEDVPSWPMAEEDGQTRPPVKFAAAWLIEKAGFLRGTRRGAVGQSTKHALALVHYGGGSTTELLAFADEIVAAVKNRFGVTLEREPRLLGE